MIRNVLRFLFAFGLLRTFNLVVLRVSIFYCLYFGVEQMS